MYLQPLLVLLQQMFLTCLILCISTTLTLDKDILFLLDYCNSFSPGILAPILAHSNQSFRNINQIMPLFKTLQKSPYRTAHALALTYQSCVWFLRTPNSSPPSSLWTSASSAWNDLLSYSCASQSYLLFENVTSSESFPGLLHSHTESFSFSSAYFYSNTYHYLIF